MSKAPLLDQATILDAARRRAGLKDFGDEWFFEPMGVLIRAINEEARLSDAGAAMQSERMVSGLVARLRTIDALKHNPEINDEQVHVAAAATGLTRTGSTMFHRMIAVAPGMTAVKWWECQNYAPFPGEVRGQPVERRRVAETLMKAYIDAGLMSIHPWAIDAPDEEIIIVDQFYVGTMPESGMYVPSYVSWLEKFDHRPAYRELKTVLKFLQWQDQNRKGKRWALKTPGHLSALDALLDTFPDASIIMTHRDPVQTVPSYCSFVVGLHRMASDEIDPVKVGQFTEKRWARLLDRFTKIRDGMDAGRFIDVRYEDIVSQPLKEATRVLTKLGMNVTKETENAITEWLDENARDKRAAHHYTLEEFGLTEDMLKQDYAAYRARFLH